MSPIPNSASPSTPQPQRAPIWWSNAILFVGFHLLALYGLTFWCSPYQVSRPTVITTLLSWQIANFGVTLCYHRLYSHRAFRANIIFKVVTATMGSSAMQGSIKWWALRHRLHHRFTDHPVHDPYAASRGLFFSHMGWIFFKPRYEKMDCIEKADLEADPLVQFQHRYYVPIAIFTGLVMPTSIGMIWASPLESFLWVGLVGRITIWHTTFIVNSLAHWDGLQAYSEETSARGHLFYALATAGEGNHNFHHAFPFDYRAGPFFTDYDPSKWVIALMSKLGLVKGIRRARKEDIQNARSWMRMRHRYESSDEEDADVWLGEAWTQHDVQTYVRKNPTSCLLIIDGYVIDATSYMVEHPGGARLLRSHSCQVDDASPDTCVYDASWAFKGGFNHHSRIARLRMQKLRIARVKPKETLQ